MTRRHRPKPPPHQANVWQQARCGACGKIGYIDRAQAKKALRTRHPADHNDYNVYPCRDGAPWWHLGHKPGTKRAAS